MTNLEQLEALSAKVRWAILRSTTAAGSGHPTSSLSAVELMVGLMFSGEFRADLNNPAYRNNDRLIFSKGHAAPLLYALYYAAGKGTAGQLTKLRKFGSRLEGHPTLSFQYTEAPTGSLGQGLSLGLGQAIAASIDRLPYRTYVLLGDSEMAEGSVWEAIMLAGHRGQSNLTAILDVNRLGQSGPTMLEHDVKTYVQRVKSFGWHVMPVDGHSLPEIQQAYAEARKMKKRPSMIVAKTLKGKGVSSVQNKEGWHGKVLDAEAAAKAMKELGKVDLKVRGLVAKPLRPAKKAVKRLPLKPPPYAPKALVAPRKAVAAALVRLGRAFPELVVLDGEVKNSTYTEWFEAKQKRRFIEAYIAEQNMAGMAEGLAVRGKIPVTATFAAFWPRAFDQIRMSQYAKTHQIFIGTHVGVHIGADGASQMGLEDISMFRSIQGSTVLYPSDAMAAERLMEKTMRGRGIQYVRVTRGDLPLLYKPSTRFTIGGSHVLRKSSNDRMTVVGAGITVFEALKAADQLAKRKKPIRVIDLYSIKPIDVQTLKQAAKETGKVLVVEDHHPEGGIAEAVRSGLGKDAGLVISLAVTKTPRSGTPDQLLKHQGIDASAIVKTVQRYAR